MSALAHSTSTRRHARHHAVALKPDLRERKNLEEKKKRAEVVVLVPRQHVPLVAVPARKRSGAAAALTLLGVAAVHVAIGWAISYQPAPKITQAEIPPMTVEFYRPPVEQPPEPEQPKEEPPPKPPEPVVQKPKPAPEPVQKPVEPKPEPVPVQEVVAVEPVPTPPPPPPAPVLTKASADAGYLRNPAPNYPRFAQDQGWEGSVILNVLVLPNGKPKAIELLQSSGRKILDDAAVNSVRRWSFVPATLDDVPIESWVEVPIDFKLQ